MELTHAQCNGTLLHCSTQYHTAAHSTIPQCTAPTHTCRDNELGTQAVRASSHERRHLALVVVPLPAPVTNLQCGAAHA